MAKNGFKLIDAEMHVMEPTDLWQRYIDPEFRERAPRRLDERRWDIRTLVEGEVMAQIPGGDWPALSDAEEKALAERYTIDAAEAHRTGLINGVVPNDRLLDEAYRWARQLAEGGPRALATTKELLRRFSSQALSVEEAAQASAAPRVTQECQEGLRAFFEKKPAPWSPPPP